MKKITSIILYIVFTFLSGFSQVVKIETLSTGLLYPVCIQNSGLPNDNRLFVVEKRGRIKIVNRLTGAVNPVPFLDIYGKVYPISSVGDERGLLGLAFHPDYANNGYFYVDYVTPGGKTVIARYQVSAFADTAFSTSEQIMLTIFQPYANHKGGNLMFGPEDGYLYISMGDGGSGGDPGNRAQNKDSLLGKTLRINVNNPAPPYYFSAPGNPFYGATPGRDEIYNWGLRNPWRCSFDRLTHDLWIADVGQNVYEEINFRPRCDSVGHNYGWRCYEANSAYNTTGCLPQSNYTPPVFVYTHTLGCSVTGGYVYRGGQEGGLFGKYLFTDYCQGRIWATEPNGSGGWNTNQLVQSTPQINNNFSSFGEDVYGELYLAGVSSGLIYKLRDTACAPTAYINAPDTLFICGGSPLKLEAIYGTGLTYNWSISSASTWTITSGQGSNLIQTTPNLNSSAVVVVTVSNGTCTTVSNSVVVIPSVSFSGLGTAYCNNMLPVSLSGSPQGGTFNGTGVLGFNFNPMLAGAGTHTITYTVADTSSTCYYTASGCVLSYSKTVVVDQCVGVVEHKLVNEINIYPNPGQSDFYVEYYATRAEAVDITLSDVLGRTLYSDYFETQTGKQTYHLKLSQASDGLYFFVLRSKQSTSVAKIIVSK